MAITASIFTAAAAVGSVVQGADSARRAGDQNCRHDPYSCGVRSSDVTVVIRVIRQSDRSRFISSRYDR